MNQYTDSKQLAPENTWKECYESTELKLSTGVSTIYSAQMNRRQILQFISISSFDEIQPYPYKPP